MKMKLKLFAANMKLPFVNWYIKLMDSRKESQELEEDGIIRASSAKIIVTKTDGEPYYEIKYFDLGDRKWHIGYSSYKLKNVVEWRKECFKIVEGEDEE